MHLARRIGNLEQVARTSGHCAICRGEGLGRDAVEMDGVELESLDPIGCPRCGKDRIHSKMIVSYPGDAHAHERFVFTRVFKYKDPDPASTARVMAQQGAMWGGA